MTSTIPKIRVVTWTKPSGRAPLFQKCIHTHTLTLLVDEEIVKAATVLAEAFKYGQCPHFVQGSPSLYVNRVLCWGLGQQRRSASAVP
jgi:hypothetical protein